MTWDETYIPTLRRTVGQRVQSAGYYLVGEVRQVVSIAGRTVTHVPITRGKNKGGTKKVVGPMNSNPSSPGFAPHRQTGRYRASIAQEFDGSDPDRPTVRVGSPMILGWWLEVGTKRMAARPHLLPTLRAREDNLRAIVTTGSAK